MISIETDRFGRTYQIWKQNQASSCSIASCWMARGIAKQMSFAEEEWDYAVRTFASAVANGMANIGVDPAGPMTLDPRAFPDDRSSMAAALTSVGLLGSQIANVLRGDGMTVVHRADNGQPRVINSGRIAYNKPAIVGVYWNGGGGHAICVGRCTAAHVTYLDPWDGHHNVQPNNGTYNAPYGDVGQVREVLYISARS